MKVACLTVLWAAGLVLAAAQPPRVSATADPNDPEKTRPVVPREEREKLGLTPKTWTGVVQPEVYARLDNLKKAMASAREKVNAGTKDERVFQAWWAGTQTEGTVYVQIHLKDQAAQRRVLASLKASEVQRPYLFTKLPALTAHVTKEALDKLAESPDVLGVCLDDKPVPDTRRGIITKDGLPALKAGDESGEQPGVKEGKIEAEVYRAFAISDRVRVTVSLRGESLPELTDKGPEVRTRLVRRHQAEKQLQDRVLASVSADDLELIARIGSGVSAYITREGAHKLARHPDVQRISLPVLMTTQIIQNSSQH